MKKSVLGGWAAAAFLVFAAALGISLDANRHVVSAAASPGKQWLMKMDTDKDGTVSKDEMMKYMGAEFDRADLNHDGTLDARELAQFRANLAGGK